MIFRHVEVSSSKISSGITILGKPFLSSSIGTMFVNLVVLYVAATCSIVCIFGLLFCVRVLV